MLRTSRDLPVLTSSRLVLRILEVGDASRMASFRIQNKQHLEPWEPVRRPEFFTENFWFSQAQALQREFMHDRSICFSLFTQDESELIGVCNFTNIVRGTFQSCHLGYALAEKHQGRGFMSEALQLSCRYIFQQQRLHRIMASYLPRNDKSGRLLASLGFEIEGHAKKYLNINGRWEDHVLTSLINPQDL